MAARQRSARPDDGGWFWSLRFSGYSILVVVIALVAVLVLAPNVAELVTQRQQIAQLRASVEAGEDEIERLKSERERWNDTTYVTSQARDRLYFVKPGEVGFIVINDIEDGALAGDVDEISDDVESARIDWSTALLGSVINSGGAQTVIDIPGTTSGEGSDDGEPDDSETDE